MALGLTVVLVTLLAIQGAGAWAVAVGRDREAQHVAAREIALYKWLADSDARLESQRRVFMERFRALEADLRHRDQDVALLRQRLTTLQRPARAAPQVPHRAVTGP